MTTTFEDIVHLLHEASWGALATQSAQLPGFPFATALPFVPDECHRPVWLMSALAEHTKNIQADCRSSFVVVAPGANAVINDFRVTLVGEAEPFTASKEWAARYLRYDPQAQQYLDLGDFTFFRLNPKHVRYVAGFGNMGWIEEEAWSQAFSLTPAEESDLYQECIGLQSPGLRLLGFDCYGVDIEHDGKRERQRFPKPLHSPEKIGESVKRLLAAFGSPSLRLF
jgi:hypothetical protein